MVSFYSLPLHGGAGGADGWLYSDWAPEPTVILSAVVMAGVYLWLTGSRAANSSPDRQPQGRQQTWFLLGVLSYLIALSPPLDDWADNYLLSAHMLQHMILMFVTAPLFLAGTPAWLLQPLANNRFTNKIGYFLTRAPVALVLSNAIVTIWHLPGPYDAALRVEPVHIAQHLSFLLAALLAWWPILSPLPAWPRLIPPLQCLYLFLYSIPNGIVGAFITFAAPGLYHYYATAPRIRGISLETDQQLAGVMMWVGGGSIYLLWLTVIFFRWAAGQEEAENRLSRGPALPDSETQQLPVVIF